MQRIGFSGKQAMMAVVIAGALVLAVWSPAVLTLAQARILAVVLVTHESDVAAFASRLLSFRDGKLVGDATQTPRSAVEEIARLDAQARLEAKVAA